MPDRVKLAWAKGMLFRQVWHGQLPVHSLALGQGVEIAFQKHREEPLESPEPPMKGGQKLRLCPTSPNASVEACRGQ